MSEKRYVSPENLACIYIGLGDRNHALDCLQRAFEDRSFALFFLYDPMWDGLRAEPRFREIERQFRLPHTSDKTDCHYDWHKPGYEIRS